MNNNYSMNFTSWCPLVFWHVYLH